MNLSNLSKKILEFTLNRVIDIIGILVIIVSIFLLLSLISYSPDDPNFIFPENTNINNLFGFYGSYTSDIFFQSFGLISFLFSISIFFNGISIIRNKNFSNLLRNFFYSIIYIVFGSAFLSIFYPNSYWLIINGNGGFVGNYINELKEFNVRTFCISSGPVKTDMGKDIIKKENPNENYETFMKPNEIAEFITFAISFDNNLISPEVRLGRIK